MLYEAYADKDAFKRHQTNEPYERFVTEIEPALLDERKDLLGFTDGLISNTDPNLHREELDPGLSRLSFGSFPPDVDDVSHFNGYAELRHVKPGRRAGVSHVHFPPGVRTDWHRHTGEQLLWFIEGEGEVALRDGSSRLCREGDIIRLSAGLSHRHGASDVHCATHIAITEGDTTWEREA
jgi:quercetin dioxygenase-like cupin family protein